MKSLLVPSPNNDILATVNIKPGYMIPDCFWYLMKIRSKSICLSAYQHEVSWDHFFFTVDDMRQQGLMQMGTHQFVKEGFPVGRVEYLPIEWYSKLHSDRHGVDK